MTDDTCGWPTTADGECQNPVGEDGTCWIPSHGDADAENPHGREFTIDEADHEDILSAAREGVSKRGCARAAGVSLSQLQRYLDAHDDFRVSFARARNRGERELIDGGLRDDDVDSSMAKFLLASSFGYQKSEKREHDIDADVKHDLGDGWQFTDE